MNVFKTLLTGGLLLLAAYGCATQFTGVATLRGADAATADAAPTHALLYAGKRPGSGTPIARTFNEQPPLIPHAIDNFDDITGTDNQCLECHGPATAMVKQAPVVATSHLEGKEVAGSRYQCNNCHVPQVDAKPLVLSTFVGTPVLPKKP